MQDVIARTGVANRIDEERWRDGFMEELRILSKNDAMELGGGEATVDKGSYKLRLEEWVHARVLYMILDMVAWMGPQWSSHFRDETEETFLKAIKEAFESDIYTQAEQAANSDLIVETAKKIWINTEGKTRGQISEEMIKKTKSST